MANRGKLDRLPEPSDWDTVDLVEVVRHPGEPMEPSVLRFDGEDVGLFYASKLNGIHGDSGVGKSWLALIAAAQELMHFGGVLWIDFESTAQETVHRLMALGVPVDRIVSSFHYISPDSAMDETVVSRLLAMLRRSDADLVVIDSLGEAFGLEGINENNDNEVTPFFRRVVRPITDAEFTVLLIDHQAKSSEHPLHASGSKRKRAAMTGSSFLVEAPQPFDKGRGGRLKLTTAKDRGGHFGRGKPAAFIDIDVWPDGGITYHVTRPSTTDAKAEDIKLLLATKAAVKAARDLGQEAPMSVLEAQMGIKASATVKRAGIEHAAMLGSLTESAGKRGSRLFRYCQDLPEEFGR